MFAHDTWRLANSGSYDVTILSANYADPDGDGLLNLMKYVMSRNPNSPGGLGSNVPLEVTFLNRGTPVQLDLRLLTSFRLSTRLPAFRNQPAFRPGISDFGRIH